MRKNRVLVCRPSCQLRPGFLVPGAARAYRAVYQLIKVVSINPRSARTQKNRVILTRRGSQNNPVLVKAPLS